MKFKVIICLIVLLGISTGCSIKEEIKEAHRIVTMEDEVNRERFNEESQAINEELLLKTGVYQFDIAEYLQFIQNDSSIKTKKESNNGFDEYRIYHANGDVIENVTAKTGENYPISYSVDVIYSGKKIEDTNITTDDLAFNLVSNYLMDSQVTDKPLEMIIKYDSKKQKEYKIIENVSLITEEGEGEGENKGLIFKLMTTTTTE